MLTNLLNKKVIVVAILIVGAVSAVLVASLITQATAQQQQEKMMMWAGAGMPEINGSVSVANETSNFINENVKASFVAAAETAQRQVTDGKVLGGHMGVVQGYLVYTFFVANAANQTGYLTVIDAGNGEVLYTSEGRSLGTFGHSMYGHWGGHGYGGWHGPWDGHGWWGIWR
ncbi:MAG TPA: hypothetical protein VJZ68_01985 [Nitrososphaera sp.]|nr:hypothetical protein [Nitrososphaera sp.]